MGEARRRKKLDPNYGKFTSLITLENQKKHVDLIIDDLYSQHESELKTLFFAEEIPDNYRQIRAQISEWIEKRFSKYRESDREKIAVVLLVFFSTMWEKEEVNNLTLVCFMEILKPYLPSSAYEKLEEKMENVLTKFESKLELLSSS